MSKYADLVQGFLEDYEEPVVEEYIVGFSGLDPDKRVKPEEISHEKLDGLLGGDFSGRYHVTQSELSQFRGYDTRITTLDRETKESIQSAREEAQSGLTELRETTASKIDEVQSRSDAKISELRADTEEAVAAAETKAVNDLYQHKAEVRSELASLDEKLRETSSGISSRVGAIEASQKELTAGQEQMTARYEEAIAGVTSDTEIIDARVGNDGTRYKLAGDNIRQTQADMSEGFRQLHEETASLADALKEDSTYTGDAILRIVTDMRSKSTEQSEHDRQLRADIVSRQEYMQEQADEVSAGLLMTGVALKAERDDRQSDVEELRAKDAEITAEVTGLKDVDTTTLARLDAEELSRQAGDKAVNEELSGRIGEAREATRAVYEHLQGQADNLAGAVLSEVTARRNADNAEAETRRHEDEITRAELAFTREQADTNAYSLMSLAAYLSKYGGKNAQSPSDWSGSSSLAIPEPRCAVVNISGIDAMPTKKTDELPAVMEFWDMQGNYFRKNITCGAQGSSSLNYVKKNVKFDLLNDDGSEFDIKIGNWVVQDGFHLKAYYTDFFRGISVINYQFWDEIMRFNGCHKDRPYKKALINYAGVVTDGTTLNNPDDLTLQLDTGALCHPDGFPCIVFLNSEFYGIFAWQLKKQRKNYRLDKSTVEHIHLDGFLMPDFFWGGVINWTRFEIRNPNKLYTMNGKKYDGDSPKELIDSTSENYDASNKDHVRSAKVKAYILDFVQRFAELKSSPSRKKFEDMFDWENLRDYMIFSDIIKNHDGFGKSWQWTTYDGVKWYVNAYDLDISYGGTFNGASITAPLTGHVRTTKATPAGHVISLYKSELEARYKELRDAGIISVENIIGKLQDWVLRIGEANYELEYERWPNSPCIINYTDSIYRVKKWLEREIANMDKLYGYSPESLKAELSASVSGLEEAIHSNVSGEAGNRHSGISGLQEQINMLAWLNIQQSISDRQQSSRLNSVETELTTLDPDYVSDTELENMLDDVFSGADLTDEYDDTEIDAILDEVFGVNP